MKHITYAVLALALATTGRGASPGEVSFDLGRALLREGEPGPACIEFRRSALLAAEPQSDLWLYAAYAAIADRRGDVAEKLLRRAEEAGTAHPENVLLLYADAAALNRDYEAELYFLDLLREQQRNPAVVQYAALRSAASLLRLERPERAQAQLTDVPELDGARACIANFRQHGRKHPVYGGVLGMIPGLGYWYSGETANGFRSLILNSLFIGAMVYSAQEDHWGAFTALTFFELTWYSGSIYGGIDAAHRYNRRLLDDCLDCVLPAAPLLDMEKPYPTFGIRFEL